MTLNLDFVSGFKSLIPYGGPDNVAFMLDGGLEAEFSGHWTRVSITQGFVADGPEFSWKRSVLITADEDVIEFLNYPMSKDLVQVYGP